MLFWFSFLKRTGVLGDHMDLAVRVVEVERRLGQGFVMEVVLVLGKQVSQQAVIMAHVVRLLYDMRCASRALKGILFCQDYFL